MALLFSSWEKIVLGRPKTTILVTLLVTLFLGLFASQFRLDASSESLVLDNDPALEFYRSVRDKYGEDNFLVVAYTPNQNLFSKTELNRLKQFQDEFLQVSGIASAESLITVPLITTGNPTLNSIQDNVQTILSPGIDLQEAKREFLTSPIYRNLLVSPDGNTTALQLDIDESSTSMEQQAQLISDVRQVIKKYESDAKIFLGGLPMITSDSIDFIRHDLVNFGAGLLVLLVIILKIAFTKTRWIVLPLINCVLASVIMIGLLGLLDWPVTVVSANFVALMLIMTLSFAIHLVVRFQELNSNSPEQSQAWLVKNMVKKKFLPCFYTAITTMVAFSSLLFSFIRPVIDFGWMMTLGIAIAFIISFTFFPAMLVLLPEKKAQSRENVAGLITENLANGVHKRSQMIIMIFVALAILSIWGISRLTVENRFIDYFKEDTEIYQGMSLIDEKLGGTTPLEVIIRAPQSFWDEKEKQAKSRPDPAMLEEFGLTAEEFMASQTDTGGITSTSYWFNVEKLKTVKKLHDYLESLPETGKVLSISSTIQMITPLDPGIVSDNFYLSILYKKIPSEIKQSVISPYLSDDGNELRFNIRIYESDHDLKRNEFLNKIRQDLKSNFDLSEDQIELTGMAVLYNNMLQNLFKSQILTLGVVFVAILIMFMILFRNFKLALIALLPNIIAAASVLSIMGLFNIPLDLMTITIAAICIGIAVDDSIHYIHRFKTEFAEDQSYWPAIKRSHSSIGRALYYTSITITLGFSILVLSNFMPTIYFGLLTGLSMMIALIANLTLLPVLLAIFKPIKTSS